MQSVSGFFSDSNVRFQIRRYDLPVMSRGRSIFFHLGNGELTGSFIHRLPCISRFPSSKRTVYGKYRYIYKNAYNQIPRFDNDEGFKN